MALFGFGKRRAVEERAADSSPLKANEFTSEGRGAEILTAILGGSGRVTAETAMQIPAVARCVHMVAQAAAMLPVKMYRKNADSVEEITDDRRVFMLNNETGDSIPGAYMRYRWVRDLLLTGAAYGYIERESGVAARIFYVSPQDVGVVRNTDDVIHKDYRYSVRGKKYYPFEFLKILRCTDGYGKGRGIVDENPLVLNTAFGLLKFQRNQLAKGGAKKGYLKSDSKLADSVIDELRDRWRKLYSNEDTENMMFLNSGMDFKEISSSAVEMQVNENMQTVNGEILRLFGSESGLLDENTVKNAVMPVLDILETAFDSDLLTEEEKGKVYFAFDTKELTRGDIGARFAAYATALNEGFMQIDEVRAQEDLPPTGMTFMKLNQADVLYDPETKRIYVLNSNKWFSFGEGEIAEGGQDEAAEELPESFIENEVRFNPYHDPENGRFTTADGGSAGNSGNKSSGKPLTGSGNGGIMDASHKMSAPLQKPPNFDNFKITEDLNAVAKMKEAFAEYGVTGNIDFSGIKNAEVLEPFLNQLKIIKADTGFVIKNIQALDIIDDDPCCIACYNPVAQRFYISRKYFNSKEALEATLNNWADNGILPKQARTVAYLAEHETAHMRIPDEILNSADARRIRNRFMDSPNSYLNDEKTTEFFADSVATCRISNGKVHKEMKKAVKFLEERGIK